MAASWKFYREIHLYTDQEYCMLFKPGINEVDPGNENMKFPIFKE